MSWRDFWNGEHSIYVNARHKALHYDAIARDIAALIPPGSGAVLDHGCGAALSAATVARNCQTLYLYDAAPNVQEKLRLAHSSQVKIIVLSSPALNTLADESLDAIVVNSLLQYLPRDEFERLLDFWHGKLKPSGRLILADVIAPDVSPLTDARALLAFAWRGGFLFAALAGLVKTFFSDYRKLRNELGLSHYAAEDMMTLLAAHGFSGQRAPANIGHNAARMTFIAARA